MNRKLQRPFDPSSRAVRTLCAIVAMVATFATLGFIDALAHGVGNTDIAAAASPVIVVARH